MLSTLTIVSVITDRYRIGPNPMSTTLSFYVYMKNPHIL